MSDATKVAAVIDRGGAIKFVSPAQLERLWKSGEGRAATARDLRIAGVALPQGAELAPPPAADGAAD